MLLDSWTIIFSYFTEKAENLNLITLHKVLTTLILPIHELGSQPIILSISQGGLDDLYFSHLIIGLIAHVISPKETEGSKARFICFHGSMIDSPIKAPYLHEVGKNKTKQKLLSNGYL